MGKVIWPGISTSRASQIVDLSCLIRVLVLLSSDISVSLHVAGSTGYISTSGK